MSNKADTADSDDKTKSKVQLAAKANQSDVTKESNTTVTQNKEFTDKELPGN